MFNKHFSGIQFAFGSGHDFLMLYPKVMKATSPVMPFLDRIKSELKLEVNFEKYFFYFKPADSSLLYLPFHFEHISPQKQTLILPSSFNESQTVLSSIRFAHQQEEVLRFNQESHPFISEFKYIAANSKELIDYGHFKTDWMGIGFFAQSSI
jgi:hypothetical protein